nr:type II toxin-antitoxin system HicA family toxin [Pseudomonas chlororaphis]
MQLNLVAEKEDAVSKNDKLLAKLLNDRGTFSWQELVTLLKRLGYTPLEGSGSRVKFDNGDPGAMINLHKPHPGNELKAYIRRQVIEQLKSGGLIP